MLVCKLFCARVGCRSGLLRTAAVVCGLLLFAVSAATAQTDGSSNAPAIRARRFLAGRTTPDGAPAAAAMNAARQQQLDLVQTSTGFRVQSRTAAPRLTPLSTTWTAAGPGQVASLRYGLITGRVTAVAIDPADTTGNTVYVGTTGGGIWKSTNAASPSASVSFAPLTDTLPAFSPNAGTAALASLSIGAVSVSGGVVLAGTGDPNDALDSYYGGGILRSTDGGVTWTLIQRSTDGVTGNHSFVSLGSAGFAWSTVSPGLVVAAFSTAAEGGIVNAPHRTDAVLGLYYSSDSGVTWQMATLMDGTSPVQQPLPAGSGQTGNAVTSVIWNPMRGRFYAAVRFHGYYESYDGITWTRLAHQPGTRLTTAACPAIATGTQCPIFRGTLAVDPGTGDTYAFTVDVNVVDQGIWRDVCGGNGGPCPSQSISFGTQLNSAALESASGSTIPQGDYNLSLAVVPTGSGASADTLVFAGTTDLYRCSIAAGCAFRNTTNALNGCAAPARVAPAQHAIAVLGGAGSGNAQPLVYIGNDGGLWRSADGVNQQASPCSSDDATHFDNLNGGLGSLAEVLSFAQHPSDPAILLAGLGANGTAASPPPGNTSTAWPQLAAGEGGYVAIDQGNPANWYVSTQAGVSVLWCDKGTACTSSDFSEVPTIGYAQVNSDASLIAPPFLLDPGLTSDIILGTCRIWRGTADDGTLWPGSYAISPEFGGLQNPACSAVDNGMVRSLAAGGLATGSSLAQNAGSAVVYAGMAGVGDGGASVAGHVFVTYAGGTANATTPWTDLARSAVTNDTVDNGVFNPSGFDISSVTVDSHDASGMIVYATVMGFAANGLNAPHVYRSVDGGAHWTNISSNLPDAPANALVVDPNDANTVYVALDTGVYVTSSVTSCASANCWSVYGTGLPNAPVVSLVASGTMTTGDGRLGELRAGTYGRGIWSIPLLNATYATVPIMAISPGTLTFAAQAVSTASSAQTVTVTNSGSAALAISQVAVSGDFTQTNTCTGGVSLSPGASCAVLVGFLPSATGARAGVLTVYGNVVGGQNTVALSGTGTPGPMIVLNPVQVDFGSINIGANSAVQNITVSNTGGQRATLGTPAVTGDFAVTANTCGAALAAGSGCTVSVLFQPTASGPRTGTLAISGSTGTQTAALSGAGMLPATDALNALVLNFGQQQLNTASAPQAITLTNSGDVALQLIAAQISSGDFTVVNACGSSLNARASCTMQIAFVPKSLGAQAGTLIISDQYRSQTVALNGSGIAPPGVSLSPFTTISFGAVGVGVTSPAQMVTLTNNGGLPLSIQAIAATGDFNVIAGSNTCGPLLPSNSACTLQVAFAPGSAGVRAGTVTVTDNAAGSPHTVTLTGTGVDFALQANGNTSATISAGQQAVYPLLLSSALGVPGAVSFTCTPVPADATCTVTPSNPSLGGTTTVSVTVATSVQGAALHLQGPIQQKWLALVFPGALILLPRKKARWLALLSATLLIVGCSASRLIPAGGTAGTTTTSANPTLPGTYNFVVAATSAGLTRSVALTLVVQ